MDGRGVEGRGLMPTAARVISGNRFQVITHFRLTGRGQFGAFMSTASSAEVIVQPLLAIWA
jgi:hypothetical protein